RPCRHRGPSGRATCGSGQASKSGARCVMAQSWPVPSRCRRGERGQEKGGLSLHLVTLSLLAGAGGGVKFCRREHEKRGRSPTSAVIAGLGSLAQTGGTPVPPGRSILADHFVSRTDEHKRCPVIGRRPARSISYVPPRLLQRPRVHG